MGNTEGGRSMSEPKPVLTPEELATWMQDSVCLESCQAGGNFAFRILRNNSDLFINILKAVSLTALKLDATAITALDTTEKDVIVSVGFFPREYVFESYLLFNVKANQKRLHDFGKKRLVDLNEPFGCPLADVAIQKLESHEGHTSYYSTTFRNYDNLYEVVGVN